MKDRPLNDSTAIGYDPTAMNDPAEYVRKKTAIESHITSLTSIAPTDQDIQYKIGRLRRKLDVLNRTEISRKIQSLEEGVEYYDAKQKIEAATGKATPNDKVSSFFRMGATECDATDAVPTDFAQSSDTYDATACRECGGEMVDSEMDGFVICRECGACWTNVIDMDTGNYKDVPVETSFYAYKRINHFKEILSQFQAKETTQIDDEIMERIRAQVKKERLQKAELTTKKTKEILKKLGYNKYYEHIPFIKDKLGIKPPVMDIELETTLCNLFNELQEPYAKCCPNDRVNFLNYYYTIYKLCELLEQHQFLPFFPMLKDRDKRVEQDAIWKKICAELGWLFIATE
jgi:hypothetical protein